MHSNARLTFNRHKVSGLEQHSVLKVIPLKCFGVLEQIKRRIMLRICRPSTASIWYMLVNYLKVEVGVWVELCDVIILYHPNPLAQTAIFNSVSVFNSTNPGVCVLLCVCLSQGRPYLTARRIIQKMYFYKFQSIKPCCTFLEKLCFRRENDARTK